MYQEFVEWIDKILHEELPKEIEAIGVNLYEDGGVYWSAQLVGTKEFDPDDPDWICNEVFTTGENLFTWREDAGWETVLETAKSLMKRYIVEGRYAQKLKQYIGVGIGFVDGDVEMLYIKV